MASGRKDTISLEAIVTTDQAKENVNDLNKQLQETTRLLDGLKGNTAVGDDLDQVYNKIRKDLQEIGKLRSQIQGEAASPNAYSTGGEKVTSNSAREFEKETQRIVQSFSDRVTAFKRHSDELSTQRTPRPVTRGGPSYQEDPTPNPTALRIREMQRARQRISSQTTSAVSGLQNASDSGNITYKQAQRLEGNLENVYYNATGAEPSEENLERVRNIEKDGVTWDMDDATREDTALFQAQQAIRESANNIQGLQEQLAGVQDIRDTTPDGSTEALQELVMAEKELLDEIQQQQKLEQEAQKLLTEIVDGIKRVDSSVQKFEQDTTEDPVSVAPREGTFQHNLSQRANAIALSMVTAAAYSIGSSLKEGQSVVEGERPDSLSLGFETGNYDFREIRRDARESGEDMGYMGNEMLGFTQTVMGSMGYNDETMGVVDELARGIRLTGASEENMSSLYSTTLQSGSIDSADQAREMQEAIKGGIIDSGMVGRQDEQVTAMESLLSITGDGREVSNEELQNQLAIMNMFASTGSESLQGANLEQNLGSLTQAIQSSDMFSDFGFLMGVGSEEVFGGPGGALRHREEVEKGLGSEYVLGGITTAVEMYGTEGAGDMMVNDPIFSTMSSDAIKELINLADTGQLTVENAQAIAESTQETGATALEEADEAWMDSPDQTRMETENMKQQRQANIDDSAVGDAAANVSNAFESFGSGGVVQSIIATATAAIGSSLLTSVGGLIFPKLAGGIQGMGQSVMGNMGGMLPGMGETATAAGTAATKAGGFLSSMAPAATSLISSAGTAAPWLMAGMRGIEGIGNVAESDNKARAITRETTGTAGTLAGGLAGGAAAGAAAGTIFGPLGTAIGGLAGAYLGAKGGDALGTWGGDKLGGLFFGEESGQEEQTSLVTKAEAGELSEEEQNALLADTQEELAMTTARGEIEELRSDNIAQEAEHISLWDSLLDRITKILEIARRQNGIIGLTDGIGNGSGSGMGVGGELGTVEEGEYWTSSDLKQHDLGKTVSELTGAQLDEWISSKAPSGSSMIGMGDAFMEAGSQSGLDPRYLVSHAAWETAWGTSNINSDKNNFYGIGAFDDSPYGSAYDWSDPKEGIIGGANWIAENYYAKGETTLTEMNKRYATDPNWAAGIAGTMKGSEAFTERSKGDVNITTNVNMNGSGNNEADGKKIGRAVNSQIDMRFINEYGLT